MSRPLTTRRVLAAALSALALLVAAPAASAQQEELTAVVANVIEPPEAVLADDGRRHLAYELQLINRAPYEVTVKRIQTLAGGKVVGSIGGGRLAAVMSPYGSPKPGATLRGGQGAFVLMDASFPRGTKLPARIVHRIQIAESEPSPANAKRYLAAPSRVVRRPAVVLAPPLRGSGWVVGNGCCDAYTAHRAAVLPVNGGVHVAERFAIDFVQLTAANRIVAGPADLLASYPYFGATVHSASAGRVVGVRDGIAETPAGSFPKGIGAAEAGGNHVVVDIGGGRYAFYAHLQPGSPMVRVGQRVRVGQPLGRLGNSGNSDAPHLHFHVMDGRSPLVSDGMPYRFTRFTVAGTVTNLDALTKGAVAAIDPKPSGHRARVLPLNNQIVGF